MNQKRTRKMQMVKRRAARPWAVGSAMIAALAGAPALAQDAPKCSAAIGAEVRALGKFAATGQDKCHGLKNKVVVGGGFCNDVDGLPFTVLDGGKFQKAKQKSLQKLHGPGGKCPSPAADPALDALPGGTLSNKMESIEALLTQRAETLLGEANLGGDPAKIKCFKAISATRRSIADKMMNAALSCQKTKAPGTALDPTCLDDSALANFLNARKSALQTVCTGLTGAQLGSCEPLPDCVVEAALAEGKVLATHAYGAENCTSGTVQAQARTASVSIQSPTTLGGVTVRVAYPRFDAGIDENGSAIDMNRFNNYTVAFLDAFDFDDSIRVSALDGNGFGSGHLFDLAFDVCRPLIPEGSCSVTQSQACTSGIDCRPPACGSCVPANKCTLNPSISCSTDADCAPNNGTCGEKCVPQGRSCSLSQFLPCTTSADCPATESCLSQRDLTACTVEAAADVNGNPVDGVSCTVVLSEP